MRHRYKLRPQAQKKYLEAVSWYAERSLMAAAGFIDAYKVTLSLICEHPKRWRNEYAHYYELGLKKYSFNIIYFIDSEDIVVIASIYHHSRNPEKKYKK